MKLILLYRFMIGCIIFLIMSSYAMLNYSFEHKPQRLLPAQYTRWIESLESGLTSVVTKGTVKFGVLYRPLEYIVLKESMSMKEVLTRKEMELRKKEIEELEHYTFSISMNDGRKDLLKSLTETEEDFRQLLLYFANDMQKDLKLVAGTDTLDCKLFHFERTYGITSYTRFVLGFEQPITSRNKKNGRTLLFNSRIFDKEVIKLHLRKEDIHTIPKVIFKY